jgi:chromosome segregation ATPase
MELKPEQCKECGGVPPKAVFEHKRRVCTDCYNKGRRNKYIKKNTQSAPSIDPMKFMMDTINEFKAAHQQDIEALESMLDEKNTVIKTMEQKHQQEIEQLEMARKYHFNNYESLNKEHERLKLALKEKVEEYTYTLKQWGSFQDERNELQRNLNTEIRNLNDKVINHEFNIGRRDVEIIELKQELENEEAAHLNVFKSCESLKTEIKELEDSLHNRDIQIGRQNKQIQDLKDALVETNRTLDSLAGTNNSLEDRLQSAGQIAKAEQERAEKLKQEVARLSDEDRAIDMEIHKELENELKKADAEIESLHESNDHFQSLINSMQMELRDARLEIKSLKHEIVDRTAHYKALLLPFEAQAIRHNQQIADLTKELEVSERLVQERNSELDDLKQKLAHQPLTAKSLDSRTSTPTTPRTPIQPINFHPQPDTGTKVPSIRLPKTPSPKPPKITTHKT